MKQNKLIIFLMNVLNMLPYFSSGILFDVSHKHVDRFLYSPCPIYFAACAIRFLSRKVIKSNDKEVLQSEPKSHSKHTGREKNFRSVYQLLLV